MSAISDTAGSGRWLRGSRVLVGVVSAAAMMAAGARWAQAEPGGPEPPPPRAAFSVAARARVTGLDAPYTFAIDAERFGADADLSLRLYREEDPGASQVHSWSLENVRFACRAELTSCRINTRRLMGHFGGVDLAFAAAGEPRVTERRCRATGDLLATVTRQGGTLSGSIRLDTGTAFFGTLSNGGTAASIRSVMAATATRQVLTQKSCPNPPEQCTLATEVIANVKGSAYVLALQVEKTRLLGVTVSGDSDVKGVEVSHGVGVLPSVDPIRVTSNDPEPLERAVVDLSELAPFVTGRATFAATAPPTEIHRECHYGHRRGLLTGDFVVHFDGFGDFTWPGSGKAIIAQRLES